jgi:hypothetical protein
VSLRPAILLAVSLLSATTALAEQKAVFGAYEVHYIVVPTTFLQPEIATQYGLTRGQDRALVNLSILAADGTPTAAGVRGTTKNLLGQAEALEFREVREGPAIYYLAVLRHGNEEHRMFDLAVSLPDGEVGQIQFQQKLYWQD